MQNLEHLQGHARRAYKSKDSYGCRICLPFVTAETAHAAPDKVVATINGTPITEGDLGIAAQEFGEQLQRIPKIQFAMRVWVNFWPGLQEMRYARASGH